MQTTLNRICQYHPCADGWKKLLAHLGKKKADDEQLSIITILDSNGLDDALWCLQTVKGYDREKRLYAVRCARAVQHLMTDPRSIDALDVAERFANGEATEQERAAAWAAARAAAGPRMTARAAKAASRATSRAVAGEAARAAWDAVWGARYAARAAEWSVARAAAGAVAGAVSYSAAAASGSVAWSVERTAAAAIQEKDLRNMCAAIDKKM